MKLEELPPSQQIEDRRRRYALPPGSYADPQGREPAPASLLDMMGDNWGILRSYTTPARGLANEAGYNLVGRSPMPVGPSAPMPLLQGPQRRGYSGNPGDYPLYPNFLVPGKY